MTLDEALKLAFSKLKVKRSTEFLSKEQKARVKKLEDEGHDSSDWKAACEKAMEWGDSIYTGIFLQREAPTLGDLDPVLAEGGPMVHRPLAIPEEKGQRVIERMC